MIHVFSRYSPVEEDLDISLEHGSRVEFGYRSRRHVIDWLASRALDRLDQNNIDQFGSVAETSQSIGRRNAFQKNSQQHPHSLQGHQLTVLNVLQFNFSAVGQLDQLRLVVGLLIGGRFVVGG